MYSPQQVCEKIVGMYPELGECNEDIKVSYDKTTKTWKVHLSDGERSLDHFLELPDAEACLSDKQCISLGLEIAQLYTNIQGKQF